MQTPQSTSTTQQQRRRPRRGFLRGMPRLGYGGSSFTIRGTLTYEDSYKIQKKREGR